MGYTNRPVSQDQYFTCYPYLYRPQDSAIASKQQIKMLKSKTVWAAAAAVVGAVGGYFTGEVDLGAMLQIVVTSVLAAFLRHGVKKAEDAAS